MTQLALDLSEYVNGVAKRHAEVSRGMFPGYSDRNVSYVQDITVTLECDMKSKACHATAAVGYSNKANNRPSLSVR